MMKHKLYYIIPLVAVAVIIAKVDLTLIKLIPIKDIQLSTLFMSFPIILALTERFNEIFVISKNEEMKIHNSKKSGLSSFIVGLFLAIAGFRILTNFMAVPITANPFQIGMFKFIDVVLTAAVIAGGTDGWHQLVSLIRDITKAKRTEVKPK